MISEKPSVNKKYCLFNCENFVLGRMAARIAHLLQGKERPQYAPNKTGEYFVIVINSDKLNVSGRKHSHKMYHSFSGYPGGVTSRKLEEQIEKDSRKVVQNSVFGMLPKNKLRDLLMKKMLVFKDDQHNMSNKLIKEIKQPKA